ncbi:PASTA domain-containing protein [Micromonospora sp. PPF5-17]|uniref:PASTA domain-containing protein n=2 Tax=Micromonosporaceae TaxID=28056 RepID=A0ABX9WD01_9ACTN|nr:PASTA domain-containing protein [Micromonospora sp. PPF5-17B]NES38967.1 PASTA domain-containing protein [Micromonospora solifontis]NES57908.1 PASTA domain-containing protein [Micromonospora sp. PPF5-6]RNL92258.1 PASTA domain-containing protein [Micromonospora solifontis]
MTDDGHPERRPGVRDDQGPDRRRLLLGGGLAAVLLAVIGASGGWMLAGQPDRPVSTAGSPLASSGQTPSEAPPTTPSQRPTATRTSATPAGLTVPELVGTDFAEARRQLRDRKLGWRLIFGTGADRSVLRTSPEPGTPVRRGITVTLWVAGSAPAVAVPDLTGSDCGAAADDLVEAGLYPRYRAGRRGEVTAQDPVAGTPAYWNDRVTLSCGAVASTAPVVTPSPTP